MEITLIGNYANKDNQPITKTFTIKVDKTDWGEEKTENGVIYYVAEDGTTSVEVTGNRIIWLKEESNGTSAWYGLDNTNNVFRNGSRFWVKWLNKNENPEEWKEYYAKLDDTHKNAVEEDHLWIFLVEVTDPDGNEYEDFGDQVPFYIQLGEDWDKEDVNAIFISDKTDEAISVSYEDMKFPGGEGTFAKLILEHFSPYAVYDKLTDKDKQDGKDDSKNENIFNKNGEGSSSDANAVWSNSDKSTVSSNLTGENKVEMYIVFGSILVCAATMFVMFKKRKID